MGGENAIILVSEHPVPYNVEKPILCTICKKGRVGTIPKGSTARVNRRRKIPLRLLNGRFNINVKCHKCGKPCTLSFGKFENIQLNKIAH
jgi:hypothetical protein